MQRCFRIWSPGRDAHQILRLSWGRISCETTCICRREGSSKAECRSHEPSLQDWIELEVRNSCRFVKNVTNPQLKGDSDVTGVVAERSLQWKKARANFLPSPNMTSHSSISGRSGWKKQQNVTALSTSAVVFLFFLHRVCCNFAYSTYCRLLLLCRLLISSLCCVYSVLYIIYVWNGYN